MRRAVLTGCVVVAAGALTAANALDVEESPLVRTALEFAARASSTSEVLTLNLTNLLILLVIKAFIFGFGLFSVGGLGAFGAAASPHDNSYGRSADGPMSAGEIFTETDMTGGMCFLMYTSTGDEAKMDCLQRASCEDPYRAKEYLTAAKLYYKMHKLLKSVFPFQEKYAKIMYAIEEASEYGLTGEDCGKKFTWF